VVSFVQIDTFHPEMGLIKQMIRKTLLLLLVFLASFTWSQGRKGDQRVNLRKLKEEQRLDEYALSLRRRDWLKDRLIFQLGTGSRYFAMGKGTSVGAAVEYIFFKTHASVFLSGGYVLPSEDPSFSWGREGGTGYKVGIAYYLFPKIPMHLGFGLSYGTASFDWQAEPEAGMDAELYQAMGYQADVIISYLTDEWYYLTVSVGYAYMGDALPGTNNGGSTSIHPTLGVPVSEVATDAESGELGIPENQLVFGIGIGFALPDMFPDDTEKRRREREARRRRNDRRR
jgi:hypothetical protein